MRFMERRFPRFYNPSFLPGLEYLANQGLKSAVGRSLGSIWNRVERPIEGGPMHAQKPGDFGNRLVFVIDELARVRDLLGR